MMDQQKDQIRSTLRGAPVLSTLRSTLNCCQTGHLRTPSVPPRWPRRPIETPLRAGGQSTTSLPPCFAFPMADGRRPTGDRTLPVGMAHWPPWPVAITTYPATISSPRFGGGPRARESRTCFVVHRHRASFYN